MTEINDNSMTMMPCSAVPVRPGASLEGRVVCENFIYKNN